MCYLVVIFENDAYDLQTKSNASFPNEKQGLAGTGCLEVIILLKIFTEFPRKRKFPLNAVASLKQKLLLLKMTFPWVFAMSI